MEMMTYGVRVFSWEKGRRSRAGQQGLIPVMAGRLGRSKKGGALMFWNVRLPGSNLFREPPRLRHLYYKYAGHYWRYLPGV